MKFRKIDGLFVLFAVAVVVGVSMLPTPKDRNPMIPADAAHQAIRWSKPVCNAMFPLAVGLCRSDILDGRIVSAAMRAKGEMS